MSVTQRSISADNSAFTLSRAIDYIKPLILGSYACALFTGAFLLFQVQPLIGKYVLPWFGGGPAVWTACMLFFQVLLLAGYTYAHWSVRRLSVKVQVAVHIILILAAFLTLPIVPGDNLKPSGSGNPIMEIIILLISCVGLPYFVLASSGPLMQSWFVRAYPRRSPYRHYSLSNTGSLIALISYPFIVEPLFTRSVQSQLWTWGLVLFAIFCTLWAIWLLNNPTKNKQIYNVDTNGTNVANPSPGMRLLWLGLAATASVELLAVTNKICLNIAVVPFLWVLPLSLYLLSFIICFHHEKWYVRPFFISAFLLAISGVIYVRIHGEALSGVQQICIYSMLLIVCCMICHGELFRLRPDSKHLTEYYLMIATGGAVGGIFVTIIVPVIFHNYQELYLGMIALTIFILLSDKSEALKNSKRKLILSVVTLLFGVATIVFFQFADRNKGLIYNQRNFFGVLNVWEFNRDYADRHCYVLQHGLILHGLQFVSPSKRSLATAYYGESSGLGLTMRYLSVLEKRRIGVVGLGVGTVSTYCKKGDYIRFYEINPEVKKLAETRFTYLANCSCKTDVVLGDARLSMESEASQEFDIMVFDAFDSDTVPVHLLTKEAFETYLRHLKHNGVMAFHLSSIHLDLELVARKIAENFKLQCIQIVDKGNDLEGTFPSKWIMLTNNKKFIRHAKIHSVASRPERNLREIDLWTDDHSNLLDILVR